MSIGKDEIRKVSHLAELDVSEPELEALVDQLNRIVGFCEELNRVPSDSDARPFIPGPERTRLRDDTPGPVKLERPLSDFAPALRDGLFVVPRLGTLEDAE